MHLSPCSAVDTTTVGLAVSQVERLRVTRGIQFMSSKPLAQPLYHQEQHICEVPDLVRPASQILSKKSGLVLPFSLGALRLHHIFIQ